VRCASVGVKVFHRGGGGLGWWRGGVVKTSRIVRSKRFRSAESQRRGSLTKSKEKKSRSQIQRGDQVELSDGRSIKKGPEPTINGRNEWGVDYIDAFLYKTLMEMWRRKWPGGGRVAPKYEGGKACLTARRGSKQKYRKRKTRWEWLKLRGGCGPKNRPCAIVQTHVKKEKGQMGT